ncbi:MAG TPA: hypothetical protein VF457_17765, partial [Burkholderiaceae bacterium]
PARTTRHAPSDPRTTMTRRARFALAMPRAIASAPPRIDLDAARTVASMRCRNNERGALSISAWCLDTTLR